VHFCKLHFQELMKSVRINGSFHEGDSSIFVSDTHKVMSYDHSHSCCHCFCSARTDSFSPPPMFSMEFPSAIKLKCSRVTWVLDFHQLLPTSCSIFHLRIFVRRNYSHRNQVMWLVFLESSHLQEAMHGS
jgi:hypothetical protein